MPGTRLGLVLLDASGNVISANEIALELARLASNGNASQSTREVHLQTLAARLRRQGLPARIFLDGSWFQCGETPVHGLEVGRKGHASSILVIEPNSRELADLEQIAAEYDLTERERETLRYVLEGLQTKQIASEMQISPSTVKSFLRLITIKTGASSRSELITRFIGAIRRP